MIGITTHIYPLNRPKNKDKKIQTAHQILSSTSKTYGAKI